MLKTAFPYRIIVLIASVLLAACGAAEPAAPVEVTVVKEITVEMEVTREVEVVTEKEVTVEVTREVEVIVEQEVTVEVPVMMGDSTISPAFFPYDADHPVGEAELWRSADSIYTEFSASDLTPGDAMTLWFIYFNYPEKCIAGPFQCGPPDLGSNREAMGDFVFIDGAGAIVGDDGTLAFSGGLDLGDASGSGLVELPEGCVPGNEGCGDPVGLSNPDGALIIVALHSHGPAQEGDVLESQLNSYLGGCSAGVIGTLPGGFSASPDEIPSAVGECATIVISPHAPAIEMEEEPAMGSMDSEVLHISDSPVFTPFDAENPLGNSHLVRKADGISTVFTTSGLTPDDAMTLWFIYFNFPEKCVAGPFQCGPPDLGSNREAMGDFVFIDGAGAVVGEDGTVAFSGSLDLDDASGTGLVELPDGCVPGNEGCGEPVGLTNPEGALVIVALHSHGPAQDGDVLESQLNSYLGGCSAGVIGTLPGGFSASTDEIPDAVGECATIHISPHAPDN